ncbi:MAG: type II secretion system protein [Dechloromonas sp.]|nr:type II secretion system protein [Dechloromonas sp.]
MRRNFNQAGFTLIELVIGMVITAIIAGMVTLFARWPVQAYLDSSHRAALSDQADTALRRLARDIRQALPNSLRLKSGPCTVGGGTCTFLEFIPIKTAGRYRASLGGSGTQALDLESSANQTFDILGPPLCPASECTLARTDSLVLYNQGSGQSDAYLNPASTPRANRRLLRSTGNSLSSLQITGSGQGLCKSLPTPYYDSATDTCNADDSSLSPHRYELPGFRFYIIADAISYECPQAANALRTSWLRYAAYGLNSSQPTSFGTASPTVLSSGLESCDLQLSDDQQLLIVSLTLKGDSERLTLLQQIEVPNAP